MLRCGTYAKCLQPKLIKDGNEDVTRLLLDLFTDNVLILNQKGDPFDVTPKFASMFLACKVGVPTKIKEASCTKKIANAAKDYFEDVVIPAIMPDMTEDLLEDMRQLIISDRTICERKKTEFLSLRNADTLAEFLSVVFLYALKRPNKIKVRATTNPAKKKRSGSVSAPDPFLLLNLGKMYFEEQIEAILRRMPIESTVEITETLEDTAWRVREKIIGNDLLKIKIEWYVVRYYQFIKSVFNQMEREGLLDFDSIAGAIQNSYRRLCLKGYTQEEIFAHLADWIKKKTNSTSLPLCEIIVAFFVQNCEVFHAISE